MNAVVSYQPSEDRKQTSFHRELADFNRRRLTPTCGGNTIDADDEIDVHEELTWRVRELEFGREQISKIAQRAAQAPTDPDAFVAWFEALKENGPGQKDPLFQWLANEAPLSAMTWFLTQEIAGEAGFDDLVALTQVKMPTQAKLELARNYWDEMGQGKRGGMHGPMLDALAKELAIPHGGPVVWESVALGNVMTAFAMNRCYAFHSIGALGVIELTAPGRAELVNNGLKRLGIAGEARRYFALHATLDVKHSTAWNREVLHPIVKDKPEAARAIAEGALVRLEAGRRCFERYRAELADEMGPLSRHGDRYVSLVRSENHNHNDNDNIEDDSSGDSSDTAR